MKRAQSWLDGKSLRDVAVFCLGVVLLCFTGYVSITSPLQPTLQRGIFLLLLIPLCLLLYPSKPRFRFWDYGLLAAGVISLGYLVGNWEDILYRNQFLPLPHEYVLGFAAVIVVLELTRRSVGWALSAVALCAILYARFGDSLPQIFAHKSYSVARLVGNQYLGYEGLFGPILGIAATLVATFILLGCVLQRTGLADFFLDLTQRVAGFTRGGAAQMAVVGSGLFGMMSGSSTSNVLTTGTTTIPLMKKAGYKPAFAGAVEAAASIGGQIMPPVMGAAAFLMAYVTGIPYLTIIIAAAIPAVLYFSGVFIEVELLARKLSLKPLAEVLGTSRLSVGVLASRLYLLLPFGVLIYLLFQMYSPTKAASWAILAALILSLPKRETRITWYKVKLIITQFAKGTAVVGLACATAGIVIGAFNLTGAGLRLTYGFVEVAGGNQFVLMILIMFLCLILGMGLPTPAAYAVAASFAAPALVMTGMSKMAAHLFVLYYACLSSITPPVAIAAYAAAGVAESKPLRTALTASGLALSGFVIPFVFGYRSSLLLSSGLSITVLWSVFVTVIAVGLVAVGVVGYFRRPIRIYERFICFLVMPLLVHPMFIINVLGVVLAGGIFVKFLGLKRLRPRSKIPLPTQ